MLFKDIMQLVRECPEIYALVNNNHADWNKEKTRITMTSLNHELQNNVEFRKATFHELASQEWFTSRISAASLFSVGYSRLPEKDRAVFRQMFVRMCVDETPLVRRVIAQNFGEMATKLSATNELNAEFLNAFDALSKDDQDSVRIQTISSAVTIAKCLTLQEKIARIVPLIVTIAADKGWRVRWSLASQLHEMFAVLGDGVLNRTIGQLAVVVENLLSDNEAEVCVG
jgi:serine/threonine-protein phosphatase 2A regulatory subunit A